MKPKPSGVDAFALAADDAAAYEASLGEEEQVVLLHHLASTGIPKKRPLAPLMAPKLAHKAPRRRM